MLLYIIIISEAAQLLTIVHPETGQEANFAGSYSCRTACQRVLTPFLRLQQADCLHWHAEHALLLQKKFGDQVVLLKKATERLVTALKSFTTVIIYCVANGHGLCK